MDKITHRMRANEWAQIIADCNASGLSKKAWMEQNHIDEKRFYYWQRRLRNEVAASFPAIVEVPSSINRMVEASAPSSNTTVATIRIDGVSIELTSSASPDFILGLIGALRHA